MNQIRRHFAFRTKYVGITNVLLNEVIVHSLIDNRTIKYRAVWDTGATNTVIDLKVVSELGLEPIGVTEMHTASNKTEPDLVNLYLIDLELPNRVLVKEVQVICTQIKPDVLIGMDIIQMGDFNISNANKKTTFSYCMPSCDNPVDLLEKANAINKRLFKKRPK